LEKKTKKREKLLKKKGEESLWIAAVIHSVLCVGEQKSINIILKNKEIK